ncbi:MAG: hypothetical protein ACR5K4_02180 [Sodalis sp. (in: enterobacteria)]
MIDLIVDLGMASHTPAGHAIYSTSPLKMYGQLLALQDYRIWYHVT